MAHLPPKCDGGLLSPGGGEISLYYVASRWTYLMLCVYHLLIQAPSQAQVGFRVSLIGCSTEGGGFWGA